MAIDNLASKVMYCESGTSHTILAVSNQEDTVHLKP